MQVMLRHATGIADGPVTTIMPKWDVLAWLAHDANGLSAQNCSKWYKNGGILGSNIRSKLLVWRDLPVHQVNGLFWLWIHNIFSIINKQAVSCCPLSWTSGLGTARTQAHASLSTTSTRPCHAWGIPKQNGPHVGSFSMAHMPSYSTSNKGTQNGRLASRFSRKPARPGSADSRKTGWLKFKIWGKSSKNM